MLASLSVRAVGSNPVWPEPNGIPPLTREPLPGKTFIPGAYVISRLNLAFINDSCSLLSTNLEVATQVVLALNSTGVASSSISQQKQYGFLFLKLETKFRESLDYVTQMLTCSGRGGELWDKFREFRNVLNPLWRQLKRSNTRGQNSPDNPLFTELSEIRPRVAIEPQKNQRSALLVGLGLGFFGTQLLSSMFSNNNNDEEIEVLNRNINKINKNLKLTNQRITILSENVTKAISDIKTILDKFVNIKNKEDLHDAILWNVDQLCESTTNTHVLFKLAEIIITLLDTNVLNHDLLQAENLKLIINEGLSRFPSLVFPLEITRYTLVSIIKLIQIQRVGRHKYLMLLPLMRSTEYQAYTLIPHPLSLDQQLLVMPKIKNILLHSEQNYTLTTPDKLQTFAQNIHIMTELTPLYTQNKTTCELGGFNGNVTIMLKFCNYEKIGEINDSVIINTQKNRLAYFTTRTRVELDCPDGKVKDTLQGLHTLPLECDIATSNEYWPAKRSEIINIIDLTTNKPIRFDSSYLPIITLDKTSEVHDSLKKMIKELPGKSDKFTFDFTEMDYSLEEVQSYSIIAHGVISVLVIIHSVIIALIIIKWFINNRKKMPSPFPGNLTPRDSLRQLRNSFRQRKAKLKNHFKRGNKSPNLSLRSFTSSFRDKFHPTKKSKTVDVGTSTESEINNKAVIYPTLERYVY